METMTFPLCPKNTLLDQSASRSFQALIKRSLQDCIQWLGINTQMILDPVNSLNALITCCIHAINVISTWWSHCTLYHVHGHRCFKWVSLMLKRKPSRLWHACSTSTKSLRGVSYVTTVRILQTSPVQKNMGAPHQVRQYHVLHGFYFQVIQYTVA